MKRATKLVEGLVILGIRNVFQCRIYAKRGDRSFTTNALEQKL